MIFWDSTNFPVWEYSGVLWPVETKSCINFRQPAPETPDNPEILISFRIIELPVSADENEHWTWILQVKVHEKYPFFLDVKVKKKKKNFFEGLYIS